MNEKKIAFIICVNDNLYYKECISWLERLKLPEKFEKDIIAVQDAPSMTAGYQVAMMESDAKYKVYLHQDVFILNTEFISDILRIFLANKTIGLIGCVGTTELDQYARAITDWNVGKVWHNCLPHLFSYEVESDWKVVEAVDGFIMATQYDLPWREDLFDGWDYYDISQCMEMKRNGYKCVVPNQIRPWCYHDNSYSKMEKYYDYAKVFVKEYQDVRNFQALPVSDEMKSLIEVQKDARHALKMLIDLDRRDEVLKVFQKTEYKGFLYLREYETLAEIEKTEQKYQVPWERRFWKQQDSERNVITRLHQLRYLLIRKMFNADANKKCEEQIKDLYSKYAVKCVENKYNLKENDI